ncbi:hypothetical protein ANCCAN_29385 [Ancylostoma caninum]|uniref:Uncharacterized protein n=1 Tax=Ancylostoma caninum TaxID=29170 RepID=A0A368F1K1_ANCCA|nr:hypothetical protein ANCCAN_29385 [Ancylostoma caninum]
MVDLTIAARREPPTCIKGTISEYERRLILFFFEEINNLTLPYSCDLELRARDEFMKPDSTHTGLFQRLTYQESGLNLNTFLWKAFSNWKEKIKKMSGKVEFGCHFLQIITCSRIVCIILNQQIPPPRI